MICFVRSVLNEKKQIIPITYNLKIIMAQSIFRRG